MEIFKNSLTKTRQENAVTSMSGIKDTAIGPPLQYGGSPDTMNPEELFVASINSCIMLVFYHFANKYGLNVHRYHSNAEGIIEKTKNGLRFTKVTINAKVDMDAAQAKKLQELSHLAEKYCLVSNSLSCPVTYAVELMAKDDSVSP